MANTATALKRAAYGYRDQNLTHSWGTVAAQTQLYVGAMVGLNAGYLTKFDDTGSYSFWGLVKEKQGNPSIPTGSLSTGTAGDGTLDVDTFQPKYFELNVVGVVITDIGRTVYALDDQTGTLAASATTYGNVVGVVKDLVYSTDPSAPIANYCKVTPAYADRAGVGRVAPAVLAASGAIPQHVQAQYVITKAGVAALTLAAPTATVDDGLTIQITSGTAFAHTLTTVGLLNTGSANVNTATFAAFAGAGLTLQAYQGKFNVLNSVGITFS